MVNRPLSIVKIRLWLAAGSSSPGSAAVSKNAGPYAGTEGSNPVPSSGESGANLSLAGIRLPTSRSRGFPRVCAARLAETRRVEQYRTKERQYLCRALYQYRSAAGRFDDRDETGPEQNG